MRAQVRLTLLLCSAIAPLASAGEQPAVTPYRPTVSNPAALSQPGWLELETDLSSSKATDNSSRGNLPYLLKFAFTDNMGVLLGGDAFIEQADLAGEPLRGAGDKSWFGWPTDAKLEELRDAWFNAPTLADQKKIAEAMQRRAFETVPYIPTAQFIIPTAYRTTLSGVINSPVTFIWNVEKK